MTKLVRSLKLNNLQYNPNRDPQVYRSVPKRPFRVQARLDGQGTARAKVEVNGTIPCNQSIELPGSFECDLSFDTPGVRVATLFVETAGESFSQDIRLDVMEHDWIG